MDEITFDESLGEIAKSMTVIHFRILNFLFVSTSPMIKDEGTIAEYFQRNFRRNKNQVKADMKALHGLGLAVNTGKGWQRTAMGEAFIRAHQERWHSAKNDDPYLVACVSFPKVSRKVSR